MSHSVNTTPPTAVAPSPLPSAQYKAKTFKGVAKDGGSSSISLGTRAGAANPAKRRVAKKRF